VFIRIFQTFKDTENTWINIHKPASILAFINNDLTVFHRSASMHDFLYEMKGESADFLAKKGVKERPKQNCFGLRKVFDECDVLERIGSPHHGVEALDVILIQALVFCSQEIVQLNEGTQSFCIAVFNAQIGIQIGF